MPLEKTVGGRERNQPETGVHKFPRLKMNLGASGYEAELGWSGLLYQTRVGTNCPTAFPERPWPEALPTSTPRFQDRKYRTEKEVSVWGSRQHCFNSAGLKLEGKL